MLIAANRFRSFAFLSLGLVFSGSAFAADAKPLAYLFDDWAVGESGGGAMHPFGSWRSPSGDFSILVLKSGEDSDAFILVGRSLTGVKDLVLGYGYRDVDITWLQLSAGEVAVVDHGVSTGLNELFVMRPLGARGWDLIYKTPIPWAPRGLAVDHCYWSIVAVDASLGSLRLKASWTFSSPIPRARPW